MAYTPLPADDVDGWDTDYERLSDEFDSETDEGERQRLTEEMAELGERIETRLNADMVQILKNFKIHMNRLDLWMVAAQRTQKEAKTLADKFKKKPTQTNLVSDLKGKIQYLDRLRKTVQADNDDFGASWFGYRSAVATNVPAKYREKFLANRSRMMNDSKIIAVKKQKLLAMQREMKALLALTDKAAMKRAAKTDPEAHRDLFDALSLAEELNERLDKIVKEIDTPRGMGVKLSVVDSNANSLAAQAANANWVTLPQNLRVSQGLYKNAEAGVKLLETQAANMANLLATRKRGLRTAELKDLAIRGELQSASQKVEAARQQVRTYTGVLKQAKKNMAKIEANFKAAAKKAKAKK